MKRIYLLHTVLLVSFLLFGCAGSKTANTTAQLSDNLQTPISDINRDSKLQDQAESEAVVDQDDDEEGEEVKGADIAEELKNSVAPSAEESLLDTALELTVRSQELWSAGDTEKAIEALDGAYSLILKAPTDSEGKSIQQKDDLRFMISKRLTEIYTSRLTTVNGKHKEIPLVVNRHVENEIKLFQTLERDFFLESYYRSGRYHDEMVKAFREAGLPEEIAWLPLIESGFKVRALSRARALGLWQFIPSTGYKFGLKRTEWIDERLDPEKSTAAAIAYLKELAP